jgi:O-acetyl-ADP-ribose deacetylase (regulator of RNase III)
MVTDAYNLPCGKVIHVVGPVVDGALTPELEDELRECYIRTLDACRDLGIRSVAFCCISTGAFRFPNRRAAEIAVGSVHGWLRENAGALDKVVFDVFLDEDMRIYQDVLSGSVR